MDSLRLILLILGLILIAGIYFWGTRSRSPGSEDQDDSLDTSYLDDLGESRSRKDFGYSREAAELSHTSALSTADGGFDSSTVGASDELEDEFDEDDLAADEDFEEGEDFEESEESEDFEEDEDFTVEADELSQLGELPVESDQETETQLDGLDFIVTRGGDSEAVERSLQELGELVARPPENTPSGCGEELIIALSLMAPRGKRFNGEELFAVLGASGFEYGEMGIFHQQRDRGPRSALSAANILKPGTLDANDEDFSTPGIALFLRLASGSNGIERFESMLEIGHAVARELDAELRDEQRSTLTKQVENHLRERIVEFGRQQRLKR